MNGLDNLRAVMAQIKSNRLLSEDFPCLLAASKGQEPSAIIPLIEAGITDFGENRVQEALAKWPALRQRYPDIRLHLIGPLQTNKVPEAVGLFDVIQTLDRPKLALALAKEFKKQGRADLQCYIQVNSGEEPQKSGIAPKETPEFIAYCRDLGLNIVGLMCVPPSEDMPAPHFALLRKLALKAGLKHLSMGMSGDFETALRMGSGCVRIGTALFGPRRTEATE